MSTKVIKRKKTRKQRRREIQTQDEFTTRGAQIYSWIETNWRPVVAVIAALLALVVVTQIIATSSENKEQRAADALYQAEKLLPVGTGLTAGLSDQDFADALEALDAVVADHSKSDAARIAGLEAGNMLLEVARYDQALERFDGVKSAKDLVGLQTKSGAALALEGLDRIPEAIEKLRAAVGHSVGQQKDQLNVELGRLLEASGDNDGAVKVYEQVTKGSEEGRFYDKAKQRLDVLGVKTSDGAASGE